MVNDWKLLHMLVDLLASHISGTLEQFNKLMFAELAAQLVTVSCSVSSKLFNSQLFCVL